MLSRLFLFSAAGAFQSAEWLEYGVLGQQGKIEILQFLVKNGRDGKNFQFW
jgi:hypothetical protein